MLSRPFCLLCFRLQFHKKGSWKELPDEQNSTLYERLKKFYLQSNISFLSPKNTARAHKLLIGSSCWRPSSGLVGLVLAISLCPTKPDIVGFSQRCAAGKYPYKYFEGHVAGYWDTKNHHTTLEKRALNTLFDCGLLGRDLSQC